MKLLQEGEGFHQGGDKIGNNFAICTSSRAQNWVKYCHNSQLKISYNSIFVPFTTKPRITHHPLPPTSTF